MDFRNRQQIHNSFQRSPKIKIMKASKFKAHKLMCLLTLTQSTIQNLQSLKTILSMILKIPSLLNY